MCSGIPDGRRGTSSSAGCTGTAGGGLAAGRGALVLTDPALTGRPGTTGGADGPSGNSPCTTSGSVRGFRYLSVRFSEHTVDSPALR